MLVTVATVAAGTVSQETTRPPGATPDPGPSAGTRVAGSDLALAREPFCDRLDDSAVPTALGAQVGTRRHYASGDPVELQGGAVDISHEYGCVFGAGDAEARAWVFAAPVSTPEARRLVREARGDATCSFPGGGPGFGSPGLASVCVEDGAVEVTHRGLLGDAWLTCRLTLPGAEPASARVRADRWCAHVVATLTAGG